MILLPSLISPVCTAHSVMWGWLRTLCQYLTMSLKSKMQFCFCSSMPSVSCSASSCSFVLLRLALFSVLSSLSTSPIFVYYNISLPNYLLYSNYPPFTHCALASCRSTLCVCVSVFCVCLRWLLAGHWPLPLLGKLCLCPWGLQICATPEPQLQLWAQAGAKSLLVLLPPPSPPPPPT